ncbi:hypothetical protein HDU97_004431 [Phlyctochytrium planicorne]|nr:hypothetical protein HDU97_004431 [Phlyctochytrium planicorne]
MHAYIASMLMLVLAAIASIQLVAAQTTTAAPTTTPVTTVTGIDGCGIQCLIKVPNLVTSLTLSQQSTLCTSATQVTDLSTCLKGCSSSTTAQDLTKLVCDASSASSLLAVITSFISGASIVAPIVSTLFKSQPVTSTANITSTASKPSGGVVSSREVVGGVLAAAIVVALGAATL